MTPAQLLISRLPRPQKTPMFREVWVVEFFGEHIGDHGEYWRPLAAPFEACADAHALLQDRIRMTGFTTRYRVRPVTVTSDLYVNPAGSSLTPKDLAVVPKILNIQK